MKYIFRYAIITQYTANPDHLQSSDLIFTLNSTKFSQKDRLETLMETSRNCIEALIKGLGKFNQLNSQAAKQTINQYFSMEGNFNADQLVEVWQSEKRQVLGKILNESCKSQGKFYKVDWQVNSRIGSRRYESAQQKLGVLSIWKENYDKKITKSVIQMRKDDVNKVMEVLGTAINFLDQNLK